MKRLKKKKKICLLNIHNKNINKKLINVFKHSERTRIKINFNEILFLINCFYK